MKRVLFTLFALSGALIVWWYWVTSPLDSTSESSQIFVIPKGQAIDTIGSRLKQANLIRSPIAFKIIVLKDNLSTKIQAGDFRLRPSMPLKQLAQELTHGTLDIWITLLEGWRREEIAQELSSQFESRNADFDPLKFTKITSNQEGYLFPDTYLVPRDASEGMTADLLIKTFNSKVDLSANNSGLTDNQVITLASILEREVRTNKDRAIVAGILIKRLNNGWPLQTDATVQYVKGSMLCSISTLGCDWWPEVYISDLQNLSSPYNTYLNQGLPPQPIANPGIDSINAVLEPQASDYWYYISDLSGNIHYAKTIESHNANINKYLR
jgi:UPF0755 protein